MNDLIFLTICWNVLQKVKFPISLDMYQFCTDDLQKKLDPSRSKIKSIEDDRKSKKVKVGETEEPMSYDLPVNPGEPLRFSIHCGRYNTWCSLDVGSNGSGYYELKAVLTHIGRSSDAGHYMAWVRDGETGK